MLVIRHLSLTHTRDDRVLLSNLSLTLGCAHDKIALIGEEGNGKSSLLKAIVDPSSVASYLKITGDIQRDGERLGYLPQDPSEGWGVQSPRALLEPFVTSHQFDHARFHRTRKALALDASIAEASYPAVSLSGGEKIKLRLLLLCLEEPTLMLLDEPSNDLDLASLCALERWIQATPCPLLFVSHDELLIRRTATSLVWLESVKHKSEPRHTIASTDYDLFLKQQHDAVAKQRQRARHETRDLQARYVRHQRVFERVQHELRTVTRADPATGRLLKKTMKQLKAQSRRLDRDRENAAQKPCVEDTRAIAFEVERSLSARRLLLDLTLDRLTVADTTLARHLHLVVHARDKVALIGPNGCGKTTFLRHIVTALKQRAFHVGWMPQRYDETLDLAATPIAFLTDHHTKEEHTRIRTLLGTLNITSAEMNRPIGELSGGQKAKIHLAKLIIDRPDVLVLDEPTRNVSPLLAPRIRAALQAFSGAIICVTHDRLLLSEVFTTGYELTTDGLRAIDSLEDV